MTTETKIDNSSIEWRRLEVGEETHWWDRTGIYRPDPLSASIPVIGKTRKSRHVWRAVPGEGYELLPDDTTIRSGDRWFTGVRWQRPVASVVRGGRLYRRRIAVEPEDPAPLVESVKTGGREWRRLKRSEKVRKNDRNSPDGQLVFRRRMGQKVGHDELWRACSPPATVEVLPPTRKDVDDLKKALVHSYAVVDGMAMYAIIEYLRSVQR